MKINNREELMAEMRKIKEAVQEAKDEDFAKQVVNVLEYLVKLLTT